MTLEQRIEALEKRCKRLGKTLVGVGTLALFAVVAGTAGWTVAYTGAISPSSITTKTIFLKDSAGKERLVLNGSNGSISAYDSAGKGQFNLNGSGYLSMGGVILTGQGNGALYINDSAGKNRVLLSGDGSLSLRDSAENTRVQIIGKLALARISLFDGSFRAYDKAGKERIRLDGNSGTLYAKDSAGKTRVRLDGKYGSVRAYDKAGKARVRIYGFDGSVRAYDKAGKARVRLLGTTGKVSFTAPNGKTISHP